MNDDSHLQERLRELRALETKGTPSFEHILRGSVPAPRTAWRRWAWAGAFAAAAAIAAVALWPKTAPEEIAEVSPAALADLEWTDWTAPTDALLADAGAPLPRELFREINRLLDQPRPSNP